MKIVAITGVLIALFFIAALIVWLPDPDSNSPGESAIQDTWPESAKIEREEPATANAPVIMIPPTVTTTEPAIKEGGPRLITWSMAALPDIADKELVVSGVARGFKIWEQHNRSLDFEQIDGAADIKVQWEVEPSPHHVGLAEYAYLYSGTITIHLGDYDCNGRYVQWNEDAIV